MCSLIWCRSGQSNSVQNLHSRWWTRCQTVLWHWWAEFMLFTYFHPNSMSLFIKNKKSVLFIYMYMGYINIWDIYKNKYILKKQLVLEQMCVLWRSDPPSADLDQMDLQMLCDGLRRYLQDLPQPVIPPAIYTQLVHTAQGTHTHCDCNTAIHSSEYTTWCTHNHITNIL